MNMAEETAIKVKGLYKLYRVGEETVRALNGVDFEIKKGEFCSIVGASGSGKSTLLNMLAGLEKPTKGEIIIAGEHIEKKRENQLVKFRREHIGFIFQSFNLMSTMNAIENVALPLNFQGINRTIRRKKAEKALKLVGLQKYMKHRPTQMSGGQQQRVAIGRALITRPSLILADEPTGNLDSQNSHDVIALLKATSRKYEQTIVMITHNRSIAQTADRILSVSDGVLTDLGRCSG